MCWQRQWSAVFEYCASMRSTTAFAQVRHHPFILDLRSSGDLPGRSGLGSLQESMKQGAEDSGFASATPGSNGP